MNGDRRSSEEFGIRLVAGYPGFGLGEVHIQTYADSFERMGLDIASKVIVQALKFEKRPPAPATLYEYARGVRAEEVPKSSLPEPEEPHVGPYMSFPEFLASRPDVRERVRTMATSDVANPMSGLLGTLERVEASAGVLVAESGESSKQIEGGGSK